MKINWLPFVVLLSLLLLADIIIIAQDSYLNPSFEKMEMGSGLGNGGLVSTDLDNDGQEELILTAFYSGESYFCILEVIDGNFEIKWSSRLYESGSWDNANIRKLKVYDLDEDGNQEIYVMLGNGVFECYDGPSMELVFSREINSLSVHDFHFNDIDNDDEIELICSFDDYDEGKYLDIYDLTFYNIEFSTNDYGANSFEIGDVDNDGVKEIVLINGIVMDGVSHDIDWDYGQNFGNHLEVADINNDQVPDIVCGGYNFISAFDGQNQNLIWEINPGFSCTALLVTDFENDGDKEIVMEDNSANGIRCYQASTQLLMWNSGSDFSNIVNICIGDPDNDEQKELVWGTDRKQINVTNANTGINELKSLDVTGHFSFDIADIDGDQQFELAIASSELNSNFHGGVVYLYKGNNQEFITLIDSISDASSISCVKLANIDDTEQDEIIIGYDDDYGMNGILILDGLSYEVLYQENSFGNVYSLQVADVDNDGVKEIVFGNHLGIIRVMNGQSYEIEWETEMLGGQHWTRQVILANVDEDPAIEIIYWTYYDWRVHVYDGITQTEQAVSEEINIMTAIDVVDFNLDGEMNICIGDENGHLTVFNNDFTEIINQFYLQDEEIMSLKIANIDSSAHKEIICGNSRLKVFHGENHYTLWESRRLLDDDDYETNDNQTIDVFDLDQNNQMEVFWGNERGLFQFECGQLLANTSEYNKIQEVIISPNPVKDKLRIEIPANEISACTISVFDLMGKRILKTSYSQVEIIELNTSAIETGVYILQVELGNNSYRQKFVKQ